MGYMAKQRRVAIILYVVALLAFLMTGWLVLENAIVTELQFPIIMVGVIFGYMCANYARGLWHGHKRIRR